MKICFEVVAKFLETVAKEYIHFEFNLSCVNVRSCEVPGTRLIKKLERRHSKNKNP